MSERLEDIAARMMTAGKGLLAADESTATIKKRFDTIGLESTETSRRDYRQMLLTADEAMRESISGVILYEETLFQAASDGRTLAELETIGGPALLSLAVRFGETRLIDNEPIGVD